MQDTYSPNQGDNFLVEIIAIVFRRHSRLLEFFFEPNQTRIRFEPLEMLKHSRGFSSGEQILIRIALNIWSGSGNAKVWQIFENLDDSNFCNVLSALTFLRVGRIDNQISPPLAR